MNANMRSLIIGGTAIAATRFYFKQPWCVAVIAGLGAIVILDMATSSDAAK